MTYSLYLIKQRLMNNVELDVYRCPICVSGFILQHGKIEINEIIEGILTCRNGHQFNITHSIPDFTWPKELSIIDKATRELYEKLANDYEKYSNIPFETFYENEDHIREYMTNKLDLNPNSRVLEIGGGDGRGAQHIIKRLSGGELYFQELSPSFLSKAVERLDKNRTQIRFSVANASYLAFPDNYFDAALHFGGINTFSDVKRCLQELARVVRPGGKIVIGDEGIGPWLRNTEMGKIMINSNPLIGSTFPIELIPVEARDVKVEWIMLGAFFLVDFSVGEGEPKANYYVPIPSERGGNHWTRYYGNLEGVTEEAKKLAQLARVKSGKSMHRWLDEVVKEAAKKELE
jgi:ubiquinone/menaquinone biosynthesis C-methylase UbiE